MKPVRLTMDNIPASTARNELRRRAFHIFPQVGTADYRRME